MEVTEKLIWFMLGKAERVKKICDVEYLTDEDIESVKMLDKYKLEFVWDMIRWYVDDFAVGLKNVTCPFCIYYCVESVEPWFESDCEKCPYGILHGICDDDYSDYKKIVRSMNFPYTIFPNKFYKGLIQDIENYKEVQDEK